MRLHPNNFRVQPHDLQTKSTIKPKAVPGKSRYYLASCQAIPPFCRPGHSCCPVKQVVPRKAAAGAFILKAGVFILNGKTPARKSPCSDNCVYAKVSIV